MSGGPTGHGRRVLPIRPPKPQPEASRGRRLEMPKVDGLPGPGVRPSDLNPGRCDCPSIEKQIEELRELLGRPRPEPSITVDGVQ